MKKFRSKNYKIKTNVELLNLIWHNKVIQKEKEIKEKRFNGKSDDNWDCFDKTKRNGCNEF